MKKLIHKYCLSSLFLALSLSSCCHSYGCTVHAKNANDRKNESVILEAEHEKAAVPSSTQIVRANGYFSRRVKKSNQSANEVVANFRAYKDPVSEQDKKDISFVVSAAANKSSISLAMSQNEIKSALYRVQDVHPLALLQFLAENPELLAGMQKIQGRDWIWGLFMTELGKVFSRAAANNVFSAEDIAAFAAALGLDSGTVTSVVEGERWPELVNMVVS